MVLDRPTEATSTIVGQATGHNLPILLTPHLQLPTVDNHKAMVDRDTDNLARVTVSLRDINHKDMADRVTGSLRDTNNKDMVDRVTGSLRDINRKDMEGRVMDSLRDTMEDQDTIKGMEITTMVMADAVL